MTQPLPPSLVDLALKATEPLNRLLARQHHFTSPETREGERGKFGAEIYPALSQAQLACELFSKAAAEEIARRNSARG